jgi:hypothetical protein
VRGSSLAYWAILHNTRLSTLVAVTIDAIGATPTLVKIYHHPETETYMQWTFAGIGGLLTMLAVPKLDWALLIYPIYVFVMNGAIVGTKYFKEAGLIKPTASVSRKGGAKS